MNRGALWSESLAYALRRAGWLGWLGLAGVLGAAGVVLLLVLPNQRLQEEQDVRLVGLRAQLARQAAHTGTRAQTPAEQLQAFYAHFGRRASIPDVLEQMQDIARSGKLDLEFGEYSFTRTEGQRLDQFRIVLPVKGPYPQLRQFMNQVLMAQPTLALQSVSMRREKLVLDTVDGRLVFVLFLAHTDATNVIDAANAGSAASAASAPSSGEQKP